MKRIRVPLCIVLLAGVLLGSALAVDYSPSVTFLKSANSMLENAYYTPKIEEVPDLKDYIGSSEHIGIVYEGYWNKNALKAFSNQSASRWGEVLGYDILLSNESMSFSPSLAYTPVVAADVTMEYALMCLYKALGDYQYSYTYECFPTDEYTVSNSPMSAIITVPVSSLDLSKGETLVFTSRSQPNDYWTKALKDKLVTASQRYEPVSLGEFCLFAKELMYIYGEPVLTDLESNFLLEVYGRTLPHSLSNRELEAVKYLMARGVITSDHEFTAPIDKQLMLDILLKIADKEARDTFKNVQITYDKDILTKGYYPTEMYNLDSGIEYIGAGTNYSTATHFDYFVRRIPGKTIFQDAAHPGREAPIVYVSSNPGSVSELPLEGSTYLGVEGSYYHFRVPSNISSTCITQDGYLTLNSGNLYDQPANYLVEVGGGYYDCNEDGTKYKRRPFADADSELYVDKDRKVNAQKTDGGEVKLFDLTKGTYEVVLRVPLALQSKITYDGKAFADCLKDGSIKMVSAIADTAAHLKPMTDWSWLYAFKDLTSITEIKDKLKIESRVSTTGKKMEVYQAFGRAGDDLLVSVEYLKDRGMISGYEWITKEILLLYSATQNVYIDTANGRVVNGTTVTDIAKDSVVFFKMGEKLFIDYHAVTGWTTNWMQFKDTNGNLTVSTVYNKVTVNKAVQDPFGNALATVITLKDDILLESSYPFASYFVYRCLDSNKEKGDWLFSFKPKTSQVTVDDSSARGVLLTKLGLVPSDNWVCYCVPLYSGASSTNNPKGIAHTESGYVIKPADRATFSQAYHYPKDASKVEGAQLVPFYTDKSTLLDYNINLISLKSGGPITYGKVPVRMYGKTKTSTSYFDATTRTVIADNATHPEWTTVPDDADYTVISTPIGVSLYTLDIPMVSLDVAKSLSSVRYYGTLKALSVSKDKMILGNSNVGYATSDAKYMVLFRRPTSRTVAILVDTMERATPTDAELGKDKDKNKIDVMIEEALKGFDWDNFTFKMFVENLDDMLTIGVLFVLNLLPRFFMFIFFLLIALSAIADVPIWRRFCHKVFDPYKFLTAGRQTVDTINIKRMVFVSLLALMGFGLFQNGLILEVIAWIARAVSGILSR